MCRAIAEEITDVIRDAWPHISEHHDDVDFCGHEDLYQPLDEYGQQARWGNDTFQSCWV